MVRRHLVQLGGDPGGAGAEPAVECVDAVVCGLVDRRGDCGVGVGECEGGAGDRGKEDGVVGRGVAGVWGGVEWVFDAQCGLVVCYGGGGDGVADEVCISSWLLRLLRTLIWMAVFALWLVFGLFELLITRRMLANL